MNTLIKGVSVKFDNGFIFVTLNDGRIIATPLSWYKELKNANKKELLNYKFICDSTGIEWQELDCHLNIASMLK